MRWGLGNGLAKFHKTVTVFNNWSPNSCALKVNLKKLTFLKSSKSLPNLFLFKKYLEINLRNF